MCAEKHDSPNKLEEYRSKRSADATPEPFGGDPTPTSGAHLFVVHKHAASRLHWDLRLEWDGVLLSWAIPQGPCLDPTVKRLAMQTEDHPLEYKDFEGVIPKGNYGAGEMIIWDRGVWVPIEEEKYTWDQKILFDLKGYKLRGRWALIHTGRRPGQDKKQWLLIKKSDGASMPVEQQSFDQGSVVSGLTVEDLRDQTSRAADIRADLETANAPKRQVRAGALKVQNAQVGRAPFTDPNWIFELKHDGFRVIAGREDGKARLFYRSGKESTEIYPEITQALSMQPFGDLVLDGEVVVLDDEARSSFQLLQKRAQLRRRPDIQRATMQLPAILYVFDLLAFEGYDLRDLPLMERKRFLKRVLPASGPLRYADHVEEQGEALFEQVKALGLEGLMAKRRDGKYVGRRVDHWLKLKADHTDEFVVVGFTRPKRARTGFGALHLALRKGETLDYVGRVGSGYSESELAEISALLEGTELEEPAFGGAPPEGHVGRWSKEASDDVWVTPRLMVEVQFTERTDDGMLRHPVFKRVRPDLMDIDTAVEDEPREVRYTNRGKLFWPEAGYTKGDLIDYYQWAYPHLQPFLADGPLVMTRYPDGIDGKSFYQKSAPGFLPGWVRRFPLYSEHTQREIEYLVVDCAETMGWIANMASIPLHIWHSRTTNLQRPDWCLIDLDPKGAPFTDVVDIALAVHALCDEIGLPNYIKTSGATGLHIFVPMAGLCTYAQVRDLAMLIAKVVLTDLEKIATVVRHIPSRKGRVYIDTLQNAHGQLIVSPYCVRPRPGAPVSTPLDWSEVDHKLDPTAFTIKTVPPRVEAREFDPLLPLLTADVDLMSVLTALGQKLEELS